MAYITQTSFLTTISKLEKGEGEQCRPNASLSTVLTKEQLTNLELIIQEMVDESSDGEHLLVEIV